MTRTFPLLPVSHLGQTVRALFARPAAKDAPAKSEKDTALEDRAFFLEMMAQNPEAVQSEFGCMAIMNQYPRHF